MTRGRRVLRLLAVLAVASASLVLAPGPAQATPGPATVPEYWFDWWNVPALWQVGANGQGITIGEIDTGVNASWPALAPDVLSGTDFGASGGNGQTDHEVDPFGHGTAMASIMVAQNGQDGILGLAPGAKVLPIAIPLNGTDDASDDDHLPDAIKYAADHGAKIISMSLGGEQDPSVDSTPCDDDLQTAITYAISKGSIVVAAAGNSGLEGSPVEEPGVCLGVVAVAAVDASKTVADFSSRHPYVDVAAPGVNIPTLGRVVGQTFVGDGTSQATAVTSAALALVWSKFPKLTNSQIVARVIATVDNKRATRDPAYGYGLINPSTAISANIPANADDPIYDAIAPYLALQHAATVTPAAAPAPVKVVADPPGQFSVGSPPGQLTSSVLIAGIASLLGLLVFVVLLVTGLRRRERAPAYAAGYGPPYAGAVAPPPAPGDPAAQWHEVVAQPEQWSAPTTQWTATGHPDGWALPSPAPSTAPSTAPSAPPLAAPGAPVSPAPQPWSAPPDHWRASEQPQQWSRAQHWTPPEPPAPEPSSAPSEWSTPTQHDTQTQPPT